MLASKVVVVVVVVVAAVVDLYEILHKVFQCAVCSHVLSMDATEVSNVY